MVIPAHNCFLFAPIVMKLYRKTPHRAMSQGCALYIFGVQRSSSQSIDY